MKKILGFLVFFIVMLPLSINAEDKPAGSVSVDAQLKTQSMIDSRVFLEKGGVEKMQTVSSNLNSEWKATLYVENKKNGAWGWVSILVPSLGNWIVGDKFGGIISVAGLGGGFMILLVGAMQTEGGVTETSQTSTSYSYKHYGGTITSAGIAIMITGGVVMLASYVFSPISALSYADDYNLKLKAGLGIASIDSIEFNHRLIAEDMNTAKTSPELFHMNLLSYGF